MKKAFLVMLFVFSIMIVGCESGTSEVPEGGPAADELLETPGMEDGPADPGPDAEEEEDSTDGEG